MDKKEKIQFAKQQLADLWKCDASVFEEESNVFMEATDTFFSIFTFGSHAIIRGDPEIVAWCLDRFKSTLARDIMDGDNLYLLDTKLRAMGKKLAGEHIRYLHLHPEKTVSPPSGFAFKFYHGEAIEELHPYKAFDNALTFKRDVIVMAAYDGDELAALAGADDELGSLWQIGIDTAPAYRRRGLGVYLVKELTLAIEGLGKVPFYNTWSPNIASTRLALSVGFSPVWMGYPSMDL